MKWLYLFILTELLLVNQNNAWSQSAGAPPFLNHIQESYMGIPGKVVSGSGMLHPADLSGEPVKALVLVSEIRYAGTGIRSNNFSYAAGNGEKGVGLLLHQYGNENFRFTQFSVAYAMRLSGALSAGLRIDWKRQRSSGVSTRSVPGFLFSVNGGFTEQLNFFVSVQDAVGMNLTEGGRVLGKSAAAYRMGLAYKISELVALNGCFIKTQGESDLLRISLHYTPGNWLMRLGTVTGDVQTFAGFGWRKKKLQAEISSVYHQQLGISSSLTLSFNLLSAKPLH